MNENKKDVYLNAAIIEIVGIILFFSCATYKGGRSMPPLMWVYIAMGVFIELRTGWLAWIILISRCVGSAIEVIARFIPGIGSLLAWVIGWFVVIGAVFISAEFFPLTFPIYLAYCAYKKDFSKIILFRLSNREDADITESTEHSNIQNDGQELHSNDIYTENIAEEKDNFTENSKGDK